MRTLITKLWIVTAVLALCIFLFSTTVHSEELNEEELYEQAIDLVDSCGIQASDIDRAEQIAGKILQKNRDSAFAHTILGRAKFCRGYQDPSPNGQNLLIASYALLIKAMETDPSLLDARYYITETAVVMKNYDFALMMAKHFQEEHPDWARAYHIPIQVAYERKDYEEMLRLCLDFEKRFDDKKSYKYLASRLLTAYKGLNRPDDAEAVYFKLIRDNEGEGWPLASYAEFLSKDRKDYDKAMEYAQKAMAMTDHEEPKIIFADAAVAKGLYLYRSKNKPEEAEAYYDKATEAYPYHFDAWKQLTIINYELGMKNNDEERLFRAMFTGAMTRKIGFQDPTWDEYLNNLNRELDKTITQPKNPPK
jgi:tetratricopeptide (TPR) repeat protein